MHSRASALFSTILRTCGASSYNSLSRSRHGGVSAKPTTTITPFHKWIRCTNRLLTTWTPLGLTVTVVGLLKPNPHQYSPRHRDIFIEAERIQPDLVRFYRSSPSMPMSKNRKEKPPPPSSSSSSPQKKAEDSDFYEKAFKFLVVVGCLYIVCFWILPWILIIIFALILYFIWRRKVNGIRSHAFQLCKDNKDVVAALGSPVKMVNDGFRLTYNINDTLDKLSMSFRVKGPLQKGIVNFGMRMNERGDWQYTQLEVEVEDGRTIRVPYPGPYDRRKIF